MQCQRFAVRFFVRSVDPTAGILTYFKEIECKMTKICKQIWC